MSLPFVFDKIAANAIKTEVSSLEKTKEEAIRTGKKTDEAIEKLENLKIEDYGNLLNRFSQEELRSNNGILKQVAIIVKRGNRRTYQKDSFANSSGRTSAKEQEQQI